eukprot:6375924-Amphidinium_carterae.1
MNTSPRDSEGDLSCCTVIHLTNAELQMVLSPRTRIAGTSFFMAVCGNGVVSNQTAQKRTRKT